MAFWIQRDVAPARSEQDESDRVPALSARAPGGDEQAEGDQREAGCRHRARPSPGQARQAGGTKHKEDSPSPPRLAQQRPEGQGDGTRACPARQACLLHTCPTFSGPTHHPHEACEWNPAMRTTLRLSLEVSPRLNRLTPCVKIPSKKKKRWVIVMGACLLQGTTGPTRSPDPLLRGV